MFFPKYLGERLKLDTDIILLHGCFDSRLIPKCAVILLSNCQVGCNFANFVYSHPCIGHRFVSSLVTERSILVNVRSTLDMFSKFCNLCSASEENARGSRISLLCVLCFEIHNPSLFSPSPLWRKHAWNL